MKTKSHLQLTDEELENKFESYTLKPNMFTHEAHLRLAHIHIRKYGVIQAEKNMCSQIEGYAISLGVRDKFNKTVTIAAVKVVDHFMRKSDTINFTDFIHENPRLLTNFKELLKEHYSFNIFSDKEAKRKFIAPDLAPFT